MSKSFGREQKNALILHMFKSEKKKKGKTLKITVFASLSYIGEQYTLTVKSSQIIKIIKH